MLLMYRVCVRARLIRTARKSLVVQLQPADPRLSFLLVEGKTNTCLERNDEDLPIRRDQSLLPPGVGLVLPH